MKSSISWTKCIGDALTNCAVMAAEAWFELSGLCCALSENLNIFKHIREVSQSGHLCLNVFFLPVITHIHISHHKDGSCQGQRGPALLVWTINTHRWPAWLVYPQMATVEQEVWKVSVTPTWHLCRWACLCQPGALTRTQQVDVGTAKQGSVCLLEEATAPWERRRTGRILTVTNDCDISTCVV